MRTISQQIIKYMLGFRNYTKIITQNSFVLYFCKVYDVSKYYIFSSNCCKFSSIKLLTGIRKLDLLFDDEDYPQNASST